MPSRERRRTIGALSLHGTATYRAQYAARQKRILDEADTTKGALHDAIAAAQWLDIAEIAMLYGQVSDAAEACQQSVFILEEQLAEPVAPLKLALKLTTMYFSALIAGCHIKRVMMDLVPKGQEEYMILAESAADAIERAVGVAAKATPALLHAKGTLLAAHAEALRVAAQWDAAAKQTRQAHDVMAQHFNVPVPDENGWMAEHLRARNDYETAAADGRRWDHEEQEREGRVEERFQRATGGRTVEAYACAAIRATYMQQGEEMNHPQCLRKLYDLGMEHFDGGNYKLCTEVFRLVASGIGSSVYVGSTDAAKFSTLEVAHMLSSQGLGHFHLGATCAPFVPQFAQQHNAALASLRQAVDTLRSDPRLASDSTLVGNTLFDIGKVHASAQEYALAHESFSECLAVKQAAGASTAMVDVAITTNACAAEAANDMKILHVGGWIQNTALGVRDVLVAMEADARVHLIVLGIASQLEVEEQAARSAISAAEAEEFRAFRPHFRTAYVRVKRAGAVAGEVRGAEDSTTGSGGDEAMLALFRRRDVARTAFGAAPAGMSRATAEPPGIAALVAASASLVQSTADWNRSQQKRAQKAPDALENDLHAAKTLVKGFEWLDPGRTPATAEQ